MEKKRYYNVTIKIQVIYFISLGIIQCLKEIFGRKKLIKSLSIIYLAILILHHLYLQTIKWIGKKKREEKLMQIMLVKTRKTEMAKR